MTRLLLTILILGPLLLAGCGETGPERNEVHGTVTLDGQPLDVGTINFEPVEDAQVNASTAIKDGAFTLELHGGLPDGTYAVSISSKVPAEGQKIPETAEEAMALPPVVYVERIAAEFNEKSTLRAEINRSTPAELQFDVKAR